VLKNADYEDAIQVSDCPNPGYIDRYKTTLDDINWTEFCTIILVCSNNCNNLTTTQQIQPRRNALKSSA
jgi:hypothetical protein